LLDFALHRGVEQWLARWAHNPKAGGSNPSPANPGLSSAEAFLFYGIAMIPLAGNKIYGGIAQLVRAAES
jgi:hypothetical protein